MSGKRKGLIAKICVCVLGGCLGLLSANGEQEKPYTNWPGTDPEWIEITNHITWCYKALMTRVEIVNQQYSYVATNDFEPTYIYPYQDYLRFSQKIDEIAGDYVDHSKAKTGTYITEFEDYSSIPTWGTKDLHLNAFGKEHWSTNVPLTAWMANTNAVEFALEVQVAMTNLKWKVLWGSEGYGDMTCMWKSVNYNNLLREPNADTLEEARASNEVLWVGTSYTTAEVEEYLFSYSAGYAVAYYPNYNTGVKSCHSISSWRHYMRPILIDNCADFPADVTVYLAIGTAYNTENYYHPQFDEIESAYYFDFADIRPDMPQYAEIPVEYLGLCQNTNLVADFPLAANIDVNPMSKCAVTNWPSPWGDVSMFTNSYFGANVWGYSLWLMKYQIDDGVAPSFTPRPKVENPDTDRDDLVEVGFDLSPEGNKTGVVALNLDDENACSYIPLGTLPAWAQVMPVHPYLAHGAFANLPYQSSVQGDEDGYYWAYSLNTRIEESGAIVSSNQHVKQVLLIRPRGNAVIFDFPWTNGQFSDQGYPIGINQNRAYVLYDRTPQNHADKSFDLQFLSGVVHSFDGRLSKATRSDGVTKTIDAPAESIWNIQIYRDPETGCPIGASDSKYRMGITWQNDTISHVSYTNQRSASEVVDVDIDLDGQKRVSSISKTQYLETDAVIADGGQSVSYGSGIRLSKSASGEYGSARNVSLVKDVPGIGSVSRISREDAFGRVTEDSLVSQGKSCITRFTYYPAGTNRYANGMRKCLKVKSILSPDGNLQEFTYTQGQGWLATQTRQIDGQHTKRLVYSYISDGTNPDGPPRFVDRPDCVESYFDGTLVGKKLFQYNGINVSRQSCATSSSAWGNATNITDGETYYGRGDYSGEYEDYFSEDYLWAYYTAHGEELSYFVNTDIRIGLPYGIGTPQGGFSYLYETDSTNLIRYRFDYSGKTTITTLNHEGNVLEYMEIENGFTNNHVVSADDIQGRIINTVFMDGSTVEYSNFSPYGPQTIKGVDNSTLTVAYNALGLPASILDNSRDILTTYGYDPLGNQVSMSRSGGGKTESETAAFDNLGRLTRKQDRLGGVTTFSYGSIADGTRCDIFPSTGGSITEEYDFTGKLRKRTGSAASQQIAVDCGIADGEYYEKVENADKPDEYETTFYNFLGLPERIKRPGSGGHSIQIVTDTRLNVTSVKDEDDLTWVQTCDGANRPVLNGMALDERTTPVPASKDRLVKAERTVLGSGIRQEWLGFPADDRGDTASLLMVEADASGTNGQFSLFGRQGSFARSAFSANGSYAETVQNPDGTEDEYIYSKWRLAQHNHRGAGDMLVERTDYVYDGLGYLEYTETLAGGVSYRTTYHRDSKNRIEKIYSSDTNRQPVWITYQGNTPRILSVKQGNGRTVTYQYYDSGSLKRKTDTQGPTIDYDVDSQGRVVAQRIQHGSIVQTIEWDRDATTGLPATKKINGVTAESYAYKDNRQLASMTDANGVTATVYYDKGGIQSGTITSDGLIDITRSANRLGQETSLALSGGPSNAFVRTLDGRLLADFMTGNGVVSNALMTYSYTANGALLEYGYSIAGTATNANGVTYDGLMRVIGLSNQVAQAAYSYAPGFSLVTNLAVTNVGGLALTKQIDWDFANRRITNISYRIGTSLVAGYGCQYVANDDRIETLTLADGSYWKYQYSPRGQLESAQKYFADNTPWMGRQYGYAYDGVGNTVEAGPLNSLAQPQYQFQANLNNVQTSRDWGSEVNIGGEAATNARIVVNNVLAQRKDGWFNAVISVTNQNNPVYQDIRVYAAIYDPSVQTTVVSVASGKVSVAKAQEIPQYDAKCSVTNDSRRQFVYNAFGWLLEVQNAGVVPHLKANFSYYPDGRRARKIVYALDGSTWVTQRVDQFYYDGWNMVAETRTCGSTQTVYRYTWGLDLAGIRSGQLGQEAGGIGGLLAISEVSGSVTNTYYPLPDHNGNIHTVVSATSGAVVARFEYDAYGVAVGVSGAKEDACEFRFQSKYFDKETGLYYYGYRYYDPMSTKWLSRDPLGEQGGVNLTAFCEGDPVNGVDALGLDYMPVLKYDKQGRMTGLDYMQYIAPNGTPGTGYSLYWFNTFKRLGMIEGDAFDKRFENVLRGASEQYRFGDLSEAELLEAISRGYVNEWDYPLLDHRGRYGNWAVAMSGSEMIESTAWQIGLLYAGEGAGAFWRLLKTPVANTLIAKSGLELTKVTSWASEGITPDLNPGRWVQLGDATKANFWKTGLPGPKMYLQNEAPFLKIESSKVPFANSITEPVPISSLQWPQGFDKWRGLFDQRQIKQP